MEGGGTSHVVREHPCQRRHELRLAACGEIRLCELVDGCHQSFRHVSPAEFPEITALVRVTPPENRSGSDQCLHAHDTSASACLTAAQSAAIAAGSFFPG